MINTQQLQQELLALPSIERLRIVRWLIDTLLDHSQESSADPAHLQAEDATDVIMASPLLALAGRFSGGPGDTAERAEEILEVEIAMRNRLS